MKKILAAIVTCTLSVCLLAGCGGAESGDKASDAGAQSAEENTQSGGDSAADDNGAAAFTTVNEGVLTMATNAAFPPYEYYEGDEARDRGQDYGLQGEHDYSSDRGEFDREREN